MSLRHSVTIGNLLLLVVGGCRGYKPDQQPLAPVPESSQEFSLCSGEACNPDSSSLGGPVCTPQSSDPECTNGRGIYNVEGGDYCLRFQSSTFCPMGFINRSGKVYVTGISFSSSGWSKIESQVIGIHGKDRVVPTSLTANGSQLRITTVDAQGQTRMFEGDTLPQLELRFDMPGSTRRDGYALRVAGSPKAIQPNGSNDPSASLAEYNVQWLGYNAVGASSEWTALCRRPGGPQQQPPLSEADHASFLPGAFFDPFTAKRTPNSSAVTMSCQNGGITRCLEWGYLPWKTAVQKTTQQAESLATAHAACIQMKRAAYCGGESYTTDGTTIHKQHRYDRTQAPFLEPLATVSEMQNLEAVWTPSGAACLNPGHLRVPPAPHKPFSGCKNKQLPACPVAAGQNGAALWNLGFTAVGLEPAQNP